MSEPVVNLDALRGEALARIERGERNFRLAFFAAVVFEGLFLALFLLTADLSNRTHLLLLIATVGGYTVVVLGLFALGAHVSRGVARVLRAVEMLDRPGGRGGLPTQ